MIGKECTKALQDVSSICQNLNTDWQTALQEKTSHLSGLCKAKDALRRAISDLKASLGPKPIHRTGLRYQISSLFLRESWEYLTSDPSRRERLHLVTGVITEHGTKVLSTMRKLKMKDQSASYVRANEKDSHSTIISLDQDFGHRLLAMFHSRISNGRDCTLPSSTDMAFLRRMAQVECNCLGGIFSLDGYVRFFSLKGFEIDVYGKGVTKIEDTPLDKVFQITDKGQNS